MFTLSLVTNLPYFLTLAAKMLGRNYFGIELDAQYHAVAERRLAG